MEYLSEGQAIRFSEVFEDYGTAGEEAVNGFNGANDTCKYLNADTCPDCGSGMVRLGGCFSCQSCGFQSCRS